MSTPGIALRIQEKINGKTKPLGALGTLEELAARICTVQRTLEPELRNPAIVVFAADHGIAASGVSAYPQAVTAQMVLNFLNGGAAINVFCVQHGIRLLIADAGVAHAFGPHPGLLDLKIAAGTRNFLHVPAMDTAQLEACFTHGRSVVDRLAESGTNIIGFGEMGIGNTSSAALLMSTLCHLPLAACTGNGTGLTEDRFAHKLRILETARAQHPAPANAREALCTFGGFEIAQICGAMLQAYDRGMLVLVDGFIATAAYLCAMLIEPAIKGHAIFCHESPEHGHRTLLEHLDARPILHLGMRLGEGTGCAVAYPIIQSAVAFMNNMASFASAGVSDGNSTANG